MARAVTQFEDVPFVGTPAEVATVLASARATGRLAYASTPTDRPDGRVYVFLRLRPLPVVATTARRRRWPVAWIAGAAAALVALCAGASWVASSAVQSVAGELPALLVGLVLAGILLAAVKRRKSGGCAGLHCPGCSSHR